MDAGISDTGYDGVDSHAYLMGFSSARPSIFPVLNARPLALARRCSQHAGWWTCLDAAASQLALEHCRDAGALSGCRPPTLTPFPVRPIPDSHGGKPQAPAPTACVQSVRRAVGPGGQGATRQLGRSQLHISICGRRVTTGSCSTVTFHNKLHPAINQSQLPEKTTPNRPQYQRQLGRTDNADRSDMLTEHLWPS